MIEEQDLAPILNKIWNYSKLHAHCLMTTQVALKLSVLTFQSLGEIGKLRKSYYYPEEQRQILSAVSIDHIDLRL